MVYARQCKASTKQLFILWIIYRLFYDIDKIYVVKMKHHTRDKRRCKMPKLVPLTDFPMIINLNEVRGVYDDDYSECCIPNHSRSIISSVNKS